MQYGFEIHDAAGALILSTEDAVLRLVYSRYLSEGETSSINLPWFDPTKHAASMMYTGSDEWHGSQSLDIAGTVLSWAASGSTVGPAVLVVTTYA